MNGLKETRIRREKYGMASPDDRKTGADFATRLPHTVDSTVGMSPQFNQIIGASVSEPPLVDSTDALSCTIDRYIDRYIYIYGRHPLLRMRGATRKRSRPDRESIQSMLSQHFQLASDRDRVNPAESAFWYHGKCCDDDVGLQTRGRRTFPASAR